MPVLLVALALGLGVLSACGAEEPVRLSAAPARVTAPPVNGRFDYQIGGGYAPARSVTVVERDRGEKPVAGVYSICYVNAFQTQPDESAWWAAHHPDLLVRRGGTPVVDPDWPGEYLLDTSTAAKRAALVAVVGPWLDGCARAGYRAVEPDNLDSFTRSRGALSLQDNLDLAWLLAKRAHARGLAVAQKNTAELGSQGRDRAHLDFAVAEECEHYGECGDYTSVYGRRVIEVEYTDAPRAYYDRACAARGRSISVILRDRDVVRPSSPRYRYEAC